MAPSVPTTRTCPVFEQAAPAPASSITSGSITTVPRCRLNQIAQINVGDARLLVIQPWDKSSVRNVVRAIQMADIGLQPSVDGDLIRIVVPPLTEERRRDIVKMVTRRAEEAKVAIRNVRRDVQGRIRNMERDGEVSQDLARRAQDDLQKLTDDATKMVDAASSGKEKEVMQV